MNHEQQTTSIEPDSGTALTLDTEPVMVDISQAISDIAQKNWADFLPLCRWCGASVEAKDLMPDGPLWPVTMQFALDTCPTTPTEASKGRVFHARQVGDVWQVVIEQDHLDAFHKKLFGVGYSMLHHLKSHQHWSGACTFIDLDRQTFAPHAHPALYAIAPTPQRLLRQAFVQRMNESTLSRRWSLGDEAMTVAELFDRAFPWLKRLAHKVSTTPMRWTARIPMVYDNEPSVDVPFDDRSVQEYIDLPENSWEDYLLRADEMVAGLAQWCQENRHEALESAACDQPATRTIAIDKGWLDQMKYWCKTISFNPVSGTPDHRLKQRISHYIDVCEKRLAATQAPVEWPEGKDDGALPFPWFPTVKPSAPSSPEKDDAASVPTVPPSPTAGKAAGDDAVLQTPFQACASVSDKHKDYASLTKNVPLHHVQVDPMTWQENMDEHFPWMREVTAWIVRRLLVQHVHQQPLRLPNLALLGEPGTGKSFYLTTAMEWLKHPFHVQPLGGSNDSTIIKGTSAGWSTETPGLAATIMKRTGCGNPFVLLDDIDQAGGSNENGRATDALLPLLDPWTAEVYNDDALLTHVNASNISWGMTLVHEDRLPITIRNRVTVLEVKGPDWNNPSHLTAAIDSVERMAWARKGLALKTPEVMLSSAQKTALKRSRWQSLRSLTQAVNNMLDDNLYDQAVELRLKTPKPNDAKPSEEDPSKAPEATEEALRTTATHHENEEVIAKASMEDPLQLVFRVVHRVITDEGKLDSAMDVFNQGLGKYPDDQVITVVDTLRRTLAEYVPKLSTPFPDNPFPDQNEKRQLTTDVKKSIVRWLRDNNPNMSEDRRRAIVQGLLHPALREMSVAT